MSENTKIDLGTFPEWSRSYYRAFGENYEVLNKLVFEMIDAVKDLPEYSQICKEWSGEGSTHPENLARIPPFFHAFVFDQLIKNVLKIRDPAHYGEVVHFMNMQFFYREPRVYQLTQEFATRLVYTDLRNARVGRLPLPSNVFCIEVPKGILEGRAVGWQEVCEIYVVASRRQDAHSVSGCTTLSLMYACDKNDIEESYVGLNFSLRDDERLEDSIARYTRHSTGKLSLEHLECLTRFVVNFLLQLEAGAPTERIKSPPLPRRFKGADNVRRVTSRVVVSASSDNVMLPEITSAVDPGTGVAKELPSYYNEGYYSYEGDELIVHPPRRTV